MKKETGAAEIETRALCKSFGETRVLKGVDFAVAGHEVVALVGPSGSGKSTLLRCLNLLDFPDSGEILLKGRPVYYRKLSARELSRHRARMGMVFQHFNLFPHRNVLENVCEGAIQVRREPVATARAQARKLLARVGLADKYEAWPDQLSGGQKQRVAIARALAMKPELLLLDEVTSALDVEMIAGINELLSELAGEGMTMVAVTHDLAFARRVADRICFLDAGAIVEEGRPDEILHNPTSERLRDFLGTVAAGGR